jgi:hypothetical protein
MRSAAQGGARMVKAAGSRDAARRQSGEEEAF